MKVTKILAAVTLVAALLTGCGSEAEKAPQEPAAMTVDGVVFTMEDYKASYLYNKDLVDMQLNLYGATPEDFIATEGGWDAYHDQISHMVNMQLTMMAVFQNRMDEAKLKLDEEALEKSMAGLEDTLGGAEKFDEFLSLHGMTRDQFRRVAALEIMMNQLRPVYMEKDPDGPHTMFLNDYLRCKHILIEDAEGTPEKETLAREIARRAQSGEDFDALIEEYNEDPGMESMPDGYFFTEGTMVDEFYQGTMALEENEISDPVKSQFGWHIIQRLPLREEDFTANQANLEDAYFSNMIDSWTEGADVELTEEAKAVNFETLAAEAAPAEDAAEESTPAEEKKD